MKKMNIDFNGGVLKVRVTRRANRIGRWIDRRVPAGGEVTLGATVQWPQPRSSAAAVLVLCYELRCIVIQLRHLSRIPKRLRRLLRSPSVTLAGIWKGRHEAKLVQHDSDLLVRSMIDLRKHVGADDDGFPLRNRSSTVIFSHCLGLNFLPRASVTKSDWTRKRLKRRQVRQAAVEAAACYLLSTQI